MLTVSLCYVPVFQFMFHTFPLTLTDWALVLPVSLSGFLMVPEIFYGRKILRWK
ncbi:MAG: hypothetical protein ACE5IF_04765 [Candidatus Bathyarchaeia archaeon]